MYRPHNSNRSPAALPILGLQFLRAVTQNTDKYFMSTAGIPTRRITTWQNSKYLFGCTERTSIEGFVVLQSTGSAYPRAGLHIVIDEHAKSVNRNCSKEMNLILHEKQNDYPVHMYVPIRTSVGTTFISVFAALSPPTTSLMSVRTIDQNRNNTTTIVTNKRNKTYKYWWSRNASSCTTYPVLRHSPWQSSVPLRSRRIPKTVWFPTRPSWDWIAVVPPVVPPYRLGHRSPACQESPPSLRLARNRSRPHRALRKPDGCSTTVAPERDSIQGRNYLCK